MNQTLLSIALLLLGSIDLRAATPNFLIILTDDHGYGDVSAYQASDVRTPNIDRIGREGLLPRCGRTARCAHPRVLPY